MRWDGSDWQPLGTGLFFTVNALTIYGGQMIAGGFFFTAGDANANHIVGWDGSQWQPLGSGWTGAVLATIVHDGDLIAGGLFTAVAGGIGANRIARWNGSVWQPLDSGADGHVFALAVYDRQLIAGGDFTFTKLNAQHSVYMTLHESFEGYRTILELKGRASWIPQGRDETPVYERYYLGGQNFRGFDFRTVSPKGISASTGLQTSEPIGGTWLFFAGAEITQPIVNEFISVVAFVDTGTVTFEPGFDEYRVSIGFGFRLYIPQLSPAPLAFDFGFPILHQTLDEERLFPFTVDLPF